MDYCRFVWTACSFYTSSCMPGCYKSQKAFLMKGRDYVGRVLQFQATEKGDKKKSFPPRVTKPHVQVWCLINVQ